MMGETDTSLELEEQLGREVQQIMMVRLLDDQPRRSRPEYLTWIESFGARRGGGERAARIRLAARERAVRARQAWWVSGKRRQVRPVMTPARRAWLERLALAPEGSAYREKGIVGQHCRELGWTEAGVLDLWGQSLSWAWVKEMWPGAVCDTDAWVQAQKDYLEWGVPNDPVFTSPMREILTRKGVRALNRDRKIRLSLEGTVSTLT